MSIYIEFSDAFLYEVRIQTQYYLSKNSLKTLFDFKQVVTCNRLTMANESDYESDPVRKFFDLNRCKCVLKKKNRTKLGD